MRQPSLALQAALLLSLVSCRDLPTQPPPTEPPLAAAGWTRVDVPIPEEQRPLFSSAVIASGRTGQYTLEVSNYLTGPVNVRVNGVSLGEVPRRTRTQFVGVADSVSLSWQLVQPTVGGRPLGLSLGGRFATRHDLSQPPRYAIDNEIGDAVYFAPYFTNQTAADLFLSVLQSRWGEVKCNCYAPAGTENVYIGYYALEPSTTARAYLQPSYSGRYYEWAAGTLPILTDGSGIMKLQASDPAGSPPSSGAALVSPSLIVLGPGQTARASVMHDYRQVRGVQWSSSDPGVAAVAPDGTVSWRGIGDATITARAPAWSASAKVRAVAQPTPLVRGGLAISRTGRGSRPTAAFGSDGSRIAHYVTPEGYTDVVLRSPAGDYVYTQLADNGLPWMTVSGRTVFLYDNYTTTTVDIAVLRPGAPPGYLLKQPLNQDAVAGLLQSNPALSPSGSSASLAPSDGSWVPGWKHLGLSLSTVGCGSAIAGAIAALVPTAGLSAIPATAMCTFTALQVSAFLTGTENNDLVRSAELFSTLMSIPGASRAVVGECVGLPDCVDALFTATDVVMQAGEAVISSSGASSVRDELREKGAAGSGEGTGKGGTDPCRNHSGPGMCASSGHDRRPIMRGHPLVR